MNYIQVSFDLPQEESHDLQDTLSYLLGELGYESFYVDENGVYSAYVQESAFSEDKLWYLLNEDPLVSPYEITYRYSRVPSEDWNKVWERHYFAPVEVIPGELVVRASFHESAPPARMEIIIDPKMAFGTGNHATTLGMLQLLSRIPIEDKKVIDMGCGSGILGIYAAMRGAKHCLCIDIDESSVQNAVYNSGLNGVSVDVLLGDASLLDGREPVDILLANINRNIILEDCRRYVAALKPGGDLLLSGFLATDVPLIKQALLEHGWMVREQVIPSGEWVAMRLTR